MSYPSWPDMSFAAGRNQPENPMSRTNPVPAPKSLDPYLVNPADRAAAPMQTAAPSELPMAAPDSTDPAADLLDTAKRIVTGERRGSYGNPEDNFQTIADMWTTYLARVGVIKPKCRLTARNVAVMMVLMKCARLAENPGHADSLVDVAGYAACMARC